MRADTGVNEPEVFEASSAAEEFCSRHSYIRYLADSVV